MFFGGHKNNPQALILEGGWGWGFNPCLRTVYTLVSRLRYPLRQQPLYLVEWVEVLLAASADWVEFAACFPLADAVWCDSEGGCEFGGGLRRWVFDYGVEGFFEESGVVDGFGCGAGSLHPGLHVPPHLTVCPHAPCQVPPPGC